jgi:hypothetical protein
VEGSCEHGNEPVGSIKCWEILEWLHNWQPHKKDSAAWNQLVSYLVSYTKFDKRNTVSGRSRRNLLH